MSLYGDEILSQNLREKNVSGGEKYKLENFQ